MQYLPHVQLICIFLQSRPFHVIRMIITINSDYFLELHGLAGLCNGEAVVS